MLSEDQGLGYVFLWLPHPSPELTRIFSVVDLYIDLANPVPWNHDAFDRLVLPGRYKEMILAFVESQATNRDVFDDVIEGKGQ